MWVPTTDIGLGKEDDERSIMSQISLVIRSMISPKYFIPGPEFTSHERQEQEYSLHRARGLGLEGHLFTWKNKFSVETDVGGCQVVLKTTHWILLFIIDTEKA